MRAPLRFSLLPLLLCAATLGGCGLGESGGPNGDLAGVVASVDALNSFEVAAETAGLLPELAGSGPYTVFAPNELAFNYLGEARDRLLDPAVRPLLVRVLRHHVVPGDVSPDDLTDGATLQTLDGTPLHVRRFGGRIYVGEAQVDTVSYRATNGRAYEVRSVLREHLTTHDRLRLSPSADPFLDMLSRAGLLSTLDDDGPFTAFVPIDDGYRRLGTSSLNLLYSAGNADLLGRLSRFHLVPGRVEALADGDALTTLEGSTLDVRRVNGELTVGGERVLSAPIETADGVIYLVSRPLLANITLAERLRIEPDLTTFSGYIQSVPSIAATLSAAGPYTLFAPNNFGVEQDLPLATRLVLLAPENAALFERLLSVHIVPGRITTADLHNGDVLTTLAGTPLLVQVDRGTYVVGGRQITEGDFSARNGVLHRMLGVIRPPVDLVDASVLAGLTNFVTSIRRAGMEAELRSEPPRTLVAFTNVAYAENSNLHTAPNIEQIIRYHLFDGAPTLVTGTYTPQFGPDREVTPNPNPRVGGYLLDGIALAVQGAVLNGHLYTVDSALRP
ncbi:MAG TPA: fasciclin domain-containing protein [Rhodothermales bacterium]|nr:fasciclin domain-containing protein [Rhodothermales bacterium]